VDAGVVAFVASDNSMGALGIYTGSGSALTTVADLSTIIPGRSGSFTGFSAAASISADNVAFWGLGPPDYAGGVYASFAGALTEIATTGTQAPDGKGPISLSFGETPYIDGTSVAFAGAVASDYVIYTSVAGVLEVTADGATAVPGGDGSLYLYDPSSLDPTGAVFRAFSGSVGGIYVADAGVARVVADTTTPVPGGTGTFLNFSGIIASDAGNTVFEAYASNGGLYAEIGGVLMLISDDLIDGASISGDAVAWYGTSSLLLGDPGFYSGLYALIDGQRVTVIEVSDALDGRVVSYFGFGPEALSGDQLAFTAYFEDGTSGVYLANIPEPGTALLLTQGLAGLAAIRRWLK
jgi:hypothetical protein